MKREHEARPRAGAHALVIVAGALAFLVAASCRRSPAPSPGPAVIASDGSAPSSGCSTDADCPKDQRCLYRVGSCSARAQCVDPSSFGIQCLHVVSYCGCDGSSVGGLCGPPYAFGPTLGHDAPCSPAANVAPGETVTTLASIEQGYLENLAVDSTNVYFTAITATGGLVLKVPTAGGGIVTLASGQDQPEGIAVDSTRVYWTNVGAGGEVMSLPLAGGAPTTLASKQAALAIAIDASNIYWANEPGAGSFALLKLALTGGTPLAIVAPSGRWPFTVAARDGTVWWARQGTLVSQPATGGAVVTLASGQQGVTAIAVDRSHVYWASSQWGVGSPSTDVVKVPIRGGAPTTIARGSTIRHLATDGSNLYFTDPGMVNDGAVVRLPLSGGSPTTLVTGQAGPGPIAVDATSVYWLDLGIGAVMKISPK